MPAIAPIEVTGITPNMTFDPQRIDGPLASFVDSSTGISIGMPKLTSSLVLPSKKSKYARVRVRLVIPTLETPAYEGAAPVLAFENFADITFSLHERSDETQRTAIHAAMVEVLGDANVAAQVQTLASFY